MIIISYLRNVVPNIVNNWYIFLFAILSYFIGFFFSYFRIKTIKDSFIKNSLSVAIIIFIIAGFISNANLQQALYIFSSVYFGFWLTEQVRLQSEKRKIDDAKAEERRRERFYLGLVWNELRFNRNKLEEIMVNFHFDFHTIVAPFAQGIFIRYNKIFTSTKLLEKEAYLSFKSSGNIVTISSDEVFNAIEISYANIKLVQSAMDIINGNLQTFFISFPTISIPPTENELKIIKDSKGYINNVANELAIAYRSVVLAIDSVNAHLNNLGAKMEESQLRISTLIDEDKEFIKKSTDWENPLPPPQNIPFTKI